MRLAKPFEEDADPALAPEDFAPSYAKPADVTAPPTSDPSEGATAPPIVPANPLALPEEPHVPPELRVSASLGAADVAKAAAKDRQRQDQSDLRMLLLAAGRREEPHLQNLGMPEMQSVLAQMQHQPKPEDPIEKEKRLLELKKLQQELNGKPVDPMKDALERWQLLEAQKKVMSPDKEPKPDNAFTPLTPEKRAYWEPLVGALPPGATLEDVKTKQGSIVNPKATQAIAAAGIGIKKGEIAKADAASAAKQAGTAINFGPERWELPEGVNPGDQAIGEARKKAEQAGAVVDSLSELKGLFKKALADPTDLALRGAIESRSGILAPTINMALGQGAMAANEYTRVKQSVGDLGSKDFWIGALQAMEKDPNAGRALLSRLDEAQKAFHGSFEAAAKAAQYQKVGSGPATPPKQGAVLMRNGDDFQWVDPKDVAAARADGYFTKSEAAK